MNQTFHRFSLAFVRCSSERFSWLFWKHLQALSSTNGWSSKHWLAFVQVLVLLLGLWPVYINYEKIHIMLTHYEKVQSLLFFLRCPVCGGYLRELWLWPKCSQYLRAAGERSVKNCSGSEWAGAGDDTTAGIPFICLTVLSFAVFGEMAKFKGFS